jgi:multidrug efflux pump subunit AcrA (membrane-fusion protein)
METPSKINELETADEPIREILGKVPPRITRWGNTFLFLFFVSLLAISVIIKYPEIVYAKITLISINGPKPIVSHGSGKLVKLFTGENTPVRQGDKIAYVESTANHDQVLQLSSRIDSINTLLQYGQFDRMTELLNNSYTALGELQQSYQTFSQVYIQFQNYLRNGFYLRKKSMLTNDLQNLEKLNLHLQDQKRIQEEDVALSRKNFDTQETLKKQDVISDLDYRLEKSKLLSKELMIPQINIALVNNVNQQNEKRKEILELDNVISKQRLIFQDALNTFKSSVDDWKRKYVIEAPVNGKVSFSSFLQENQQLQVNQTIGFVSQENSQYFAEMDIPQVNFGKVLVGQEVIMKFSAYPFQEYGVVYGKIDYIFYVGTDSGYLAKVNLVNGLVTNTKKQIQYKEGLTAQGEIVTHDLTLLQRLYYNIVKSVRK